MSKQTHEILNQKKQEAVGLLNRKVELKILNQANADFLAKLIQRAEDAEEVDKIISIGNILKRTGMVYDHRLEKESDYIKYLKKNESLSFNKGGQEHQLIIGDNYDALRQLIVAKTQVDVIYIDPPYGKDDMGKFAETNYTNDISRDNLLSMLQARLVLAKRLLKDDGVIFCSIDDKNYAYLKCLFDEVFGEENFVNTFHWVNNLKGRQLDGIGAAGTTEYVLAYANVKKTLYPFSMDEMYLKEKMPFVYQAKYDIMTDERGPFVIKNELYNTNSIFNEETRPNLVFDIYFNPETKEIKTANVSEENMFMKEGFVKIEPHKNADGKHKYHAFRWSRDKINNESYDLFFANNNGTWKVYTKIRNIGEMTLKDIILGISNGTNDIKKVGLSRSFAYPKPVSLVELLINTVKNKNAVILDFFAGSGTTGEAVLSLNRRDHGNRKFILCTNNEETNATPSGIAYDVTTKRLKRVMTGECYDGTTNFDWNKKNEPYGDSLIVMDIEDVSPSEFAVNKTPFDVIDETLYGLPKFQSKREKIDWVCANFEKTMKTIENDDEYIHRWLRQGE